MSGVVPCHLQAVSCTSQPLAGYMAGAGASHAYMPVHQRGGASMCMHVGADCLPHAQNVRLIHDVHHDPVLGDGVQYDVCHKLLVPAPEPVVLTDELCINGKSSCQGHCWHRWGTGDDNKRFLTILHSSIQGMSGKTNLLLQWRGGEGMHATVRARDLTMRATARCWQPPCCQRTGGCRRARRAHSPLGSGRHTGSGCRLRRWAGPHCMCQNWPEGPMIWSASQSLHGLSKSRLSCII